MMYKINYLPKIIVERLCIFVICTRIRTVPGLTCDKKVVRNDIKLAAKIITNLDTKWSLWQKEKSDETIGDSFIMFLKFVVVIVNRYFCITEIFNTYISQQILDYKKVSVISQHKNTNSIILYSKKNVTNSIDKHLRLKVSSTHNTNF
jgi:hypothetical protein